MIVSSVDGISAAYLVDVSPFCRQRNRPGSMLSLNSPSVGSFVDVKRAACLPASPAHGRPTRS